jgi:hypothetical protein
MRHKLTLDLVLWLNTYRSAAHCTTNAQKMHVSNGLDHAVLPRPRNHDHVTMTALLQSMSVTT